jgi:HNH endonuclease
VAEVIDLETLAIRDGWHCHICGKRVTRRTWSIDHLVPLSVGGYDTYSNAALAHHRCNAARGAHGSAQLRLEASLGVCAPIDLEPRICHVCGEPFVPRSRKQKRYCGSPDCLREAHRRSAEASYRRRAGARCCADCAAPIPPSAHGRVGQLLCGRCAPGGRPMRSRCAKGHAFTDENTYITPDGRRQCRTCCRERPRSR